MIPNAYISSRTANRLRIKIPSRRRDADYFETLLNHLSGQEGIDSVSIQPLTASVLLIHSIDSSTILNNAEQNELLHIVQDETMPTSRPIMHGALAKSYLDIDHSVTRITSGITNIGGIAFIALVGVGIYQISRGNFAAPAWYTAFWYALNILLKTKEQENSSVV
ncbi:hypothetical protein SAMN04489760_10824 [Syntrophus gentianae]|uniref:Uncharacterized protein n=1 Tax=Syntrophus gentianae TaxID=43775 RepID=A0A1H7WUX0_9BACT|nr:hypothetical protein [Syntrophus gentianae]SEM25356.1 hypothetical protein SAMN04489760_10824 [Syntrophus gentianae]